MDSRTGKVRWKLPLEYQMLSYAAAVAGKIVYFADKLGFLYAADIKTGQLIRKLDTNTGGRIYPMVINDGRTYFCGEDNYLHCVE